MKKLLLAIIPVFLLSCSASSTLTLSVPQPSNVYLSKEAKNIGILNRSIPAVKYNAIDAIDKILTAKEKNLDKKGAEETIQGLYESLSQNNRFTNVIIIDSLILKESGIDVFSPELKQEDIDKNLC